MSDGQTTAAELEAKIRELSAKATVTQDPDQLREICVELRAAIHEKMRLGRARLAELQAAEQAISRKLEPENQ